MVAIAPNEHPERLRLHLKACAEKSHAILKETQKGTDLTPTETTQMVGDLAGMVQMLAMSMNACITAIEDAKRTASQASSRASRMGFIR